MLPLGAQTDENQKTPNTGYKLDGMELPNLVSQYGQQYEDVNIV